MVDIKNSTQSVKNLNIHIENIEKELYNNGNIKLAVEKYLNEHENISNTIKKNEIFLIYREKSLSLLGIKISHLMHAIGNYNNHDLATFIKNHHGRLNFNLTIYNNLDTMDTKREKIANTIKTNKDKINKLLPAKKWIRDQIEKYINDFSLKKYQDFEDREEFRIIQ